MNIRERSVEYSSFYDELFNRINVRQLLNRYAITDNEDQFRRLCDLCKCSLFYIDVSKWDYKYLIIAMDHYIAFYYSKRLRISDITKFGVYELVTWGLLLDEDAARLCNEVNNAVGNLMSWVHNDKFKFCGVHLSIVSFYCIVNKSGNCYYGINEEYNDGRDITMFAYSYLLYKKLNKEGLKLAWGYQLRKFSGDPSSYIRSIVGLRIDDKLPELIVDIKTSDQLDRFSVADEHDGYVYKLIANVNKCKWLLNKLSAIRNDIDYYTRFRMLTDTTKFADVTFVF